MHEQEIKAHAIHLGIWRNPWKVIRIVVLAGLLMILERVWS